MHKKQKHKIAGILLIMLGVGTAIALSLTALNQTVSFFYSPSDLLGENKIIPPSNRPFRMGGLVVEGSIDKKPDGKIYFTITDNANNIDVIYSGITPDLFKEGQGVVVTGNLNDNNIFIATGLLSKHDENYMPPEVKKSLEKTAIEKGHPTK